jgi:hypothetical protein
VKGKEKQKGGKKGRLDWKKQIKTIKNGPILFSVGKRVSLVPF